MHILIASNIYSFLQQFATWNASLYVYDFSTVSINITIFVDFVAVYDFIIYKIFNKMSDQLFDKLAGL